jgi:hypothetical protein
MVHQVYKEFNHLLDITKDYFTGNLEGYNDNYHVTLRTACEIACFGHDLIEDARQSYNDVRVALGDEAANIIFGVTNNTGKTRAERADERYYEKIRTTKGAIFVKLCDRIANVRYGKLTKSRQFEMYKKENEHFLKQLGWGEDSNYFNPEVCMMYAPMFQYLINLFEDHTI